jgi:two-component system sensor histidine kinase BarA
VKLQSFTRIRTAPLMVALCCFTAVWLVEEWYTTISQIEATQELALANAARDASIFARVIEEHTARTIQSADQAVQFLRYEYLEEGDKLNLHRLLDTGTILGDIFNLYSIVAPDGALVLSSEPFKPVNLADREHIRVHMATDRGLFISKPVLGRVSGKWSIQLTRRINRPDGSFGGTAVVSMDPFYFTRLYESAQISPHSVITLIGTDGVVRARRSANSSEIGQDISSSELMQYIGNKKHGVIRAHSIIDGRERMYAFRRLDTYSLLAVVGIDMRDVLQAPEAMRSQLIGQTVLSTVAITMLTAVLLFLTSRVLRSRSQAVKANSAKTQFLSNMSHELRTPLNGILGYAELLKEELDGYEHREFAQIIHSSGLHLLSLVNQLLQLNKIEAGHEDAVLAAEDVLKLLHEVVNAHRSTARLKEIALEVRISPLVPQRIECDRFKLLQVLNNLLHNAIKFTDTGHVELSLVVAGGDLLFSVADTGRGIPAALLGKVFDKFFQVDSGDARNNDGTGLGLSLVRELVAVMGGQVQVKSTPGASTVFSFTIPLKDTAMTGEAVVITAAQYT